LGKSHSWSQIHEKVIRELEEAGPDCPALADLRRTAGQSRDAVYAGDFDALGRAMIENTEAQGRLIIALSDEAMAALMRHTWPGNVRELENAIEHAYIMCAGTIVLPQHLPPEIAAHAPFEAAADGTSLGRTMVEIETQAILAALRRHDWRRRETARERGIDKTTLWRKMKKLGLPSRPTGQ